MTRSYTENPTKKSTLNYIKNYSCVTGAFLGFNPGSVAAGCMGGMVVGMVRGAVVGTIAAAVGSTILNN